MTTQDHLQALKAQCQEAATWFASIDPHETPTEQGAFNAAILKALKHAHDAIDSIAAVEAER